ncbi:MAG TPA: PIN domain protein [Nitrospiraceae bacterium]|nr:MAG: PIN domain protein [Nitrospirae bacterium GWA2_46_11]OGW25451.1 MAG: PIN domain protein [Nitrospirae bacterium GWB2_47_37]HAK87904.1 PIN domain protein [Nitrospiraceae bacterium]HCZ12373.1 PIN domain protein [Nitrospiraceae bacterium]
MRVYMDNCCLNRPFDDQSKMRIRLEAEAVLFIQEKIAAHEIELAWSYIVDYENSFNPFDEKQSAINDLKPFVTIDTDETDSILKNAVVIQKSGLKAFDALHVACAMETGCDYFITTDDTILKKLSGFAKIKVISPIEFIRILEEK